MQSPNADGPRSRRDRVEELRRLVGTPITSSAPPHFREVTPDAIRLFTRAYGDGNPIYSDPMHAERSVRGGVVAPPLFPIATGVPVEPREQDRPVDVAAVLGVAPPSAPSSDRWTLHRPLVVGTRLSRSSALHDVAVPDDPAAPWFVEATERTVYEESGVVYATHDRARRYRPDNSSEPGPEPRPLSLSTEAELAEIERAYDAEVVQGPEPRRASDVAVGDVLGPIVKGPLTVTDLVTYRGGIGPGPLGAEPLRLGALSRRRRPALWSANGQGVPETLERRHWDVEYAQSLGYPSAYDYSHTRLTWLTHLLTNWIGDGGWVWQVKGAMLEPNYVGDTHWVSGVVRAVDGAPECGAVSIELSARNQRAEVTYRGNAIVLLPEEPATFVTSDTISAFAP